MLSFFDHGGPLSSGLPGWEYRQGQSDMAAAVAAALGEQRNLVVEAGTGTGKTMAYLVPLILSGKSAVVSTGTKNLQEQLVRKDVPQLEKALGRRVRVAVMKGRSNFLCLQKLREMEGRPTLAGLEQLSEFTLIRKWSESTQHGDRAELAELPEGSRLWARLDARRDACSGRKCEFFRDCFLTKMHERAQKADLIVVNHYLFFADLALRRDDFGSVIPDYQTVVFDEAHELERIVGYYFGVQFGSAQVQDLARAVQEAAVRAGFGSTGLTRALSRLRNAVKAFFDKVAGLLSSQQTRERFRDRSAFRLRNRAEYQDLLRRLKDLESVLQATEGKPDEVGPLQGRARAAALTVRVLLGDLDEAARKEAYKEPYLTHLVEDNRGNFVHWIEKRPKSVAVRATPIDVGPILHEELFQRGGGSAILTSATLAVNGEFDYIRGRLGLQASNELLVPGHFDYARQALLYVPQHLPEPSNPAFAAHAAQQVLELVRCSQGRAFVLCTSYKNMRELHSRVSGATDYACLMQGQGSNAALLEEFRSTPHCVLFATFSFWQGVDVAGEQLSCVIIDKLPFAVPSDPVVAARVEQIRRHGGHPFLEYQIPTAALALKQGFGRLIRQATDQGVLALLDVRVQTKPYGSVFLNSLPRYRLTRDLGEVASFFSRRRGGPNRIRPAARRRPRRRRAGRNW